MKTLAERETELLIKLEEVKGKAIDLFNRDSLEYLKERLNGYRRELITNLNSSKTKEDLNGYTEATTILINIIEGVIRTKELKKLRAV